MPTYISPLDPDYISLKRASELLAKELPDFSQAEIMETFTHGLFTGEFERAANGATLSDQWLLPLLRIEAPHREGDHVSRLPLASRPLEYLPAKRLTIAEVLVERGAVPGTPEDWRSFSESPGEPRAAALALRELAHFPYTAFPPAGQALLGSVVVSKATLRAWMEFKGYALPEFLQSGTTPQAPTPAPTPDPKPTPPEESPSDAERGRPRKAAWDRIVALVRDMHRVDPKKSRKMLAFDAHKQAKTEFDEKNLPSVGTIRRHMKSILGPET